MLAWTGTVGGDQHYMPEGTYLAIKVDQILGEALDYEQLGIGGWRSIAAFDAGTWVNKRIYYKFWADPDVSPMSDSINVVFLVTGFW
jgi:hypothetical protein